MKSIVLKGYYGRGNLGDEIILQSIMHQLCRNNFSVTLLSGGLQYNHTCIKRTIIEKGVSYILTTLMEITKSDALILGGGGLFTNDNPIKINFLFILYALILRKKVCLFSIGVNPVQNKITKLLWRLILGNTNLVIVRDELSFGSLSAATTYDLTKNRIYCLADSAFSYDPNDNPRQPPKENVRVDIDFNSIQNKMPYCIICLAMPWSNLDALNDSKLKNRYIKFVADSASIVRTVNSKGMTPVLISFFENGNDSKLNQDITNLVGKELTYVFGGNKTPLEKYSLFKYAEFCIAMRFHSVVFSILECRPFFAISYDYKTESLVSRVGLSNYCVKFGIGIDNFYKAESDLPSDICDRIEDAIDRRVELKSNLINKRGQLINESKHAFELLLKELS